MPLKAGFVRTVKTPGRFGDGRGNHGLALLVRPRADGGVRKSWIQRIRINGRVTNLGLGTYPVVLLSDARKKALENRRLIEQGHDPRGGGIPTFAEAAERVIQMHRAGWKPGSKTEYRWRSTLNTYAFPSLGAKRVDRITTHDVMDLLTPIWHEKNPTAQTLKREISAIMRWAIAAGHRPDNPAGEAITAALPKHSGRQKHHPALPHNQVAAALDKARQSAAYRISVLLLEYQVLTAVRPTEARLAQWSEIDLDTATWTIAAHRTKKEPGTPRTTVDTRHRSAKRSPTVQKQQRLGLRGRTRWADRQGQRRRNTPPDRGGLRSPRIQIKFPCLGRGMHRHT